MGDVAPAPAGWKCASRLCAERPDARGSVCPHCGAPPPTQRKCPRCQNVMQRSDAFCGQCKEGAANNFTADQRTTMANAGVDLGRAQVALNFYNGKVIRLFFCKWTVDAASLSALLTAGQEMQVGIVSNFSRRLFDALHKFLLRGAQLQAHDGLSGEVRIKGQIKKKSNVARDRVLTMWSMYLGEKARSAKTRRSEIAARLARFVPAGRKLAVSTIGSLTDHDIAMMSAERIVAHLRQARAEKRPREDHPARNVRRAAVVESETDSDDGDAAEELDDA